LSFTPYPASDNKTKSSKEPDVEVKQV